MAMKALGVLVGVLAASGAATAATANVEVGHDDDAAHASYFQFFPSTIVVHEGDTVQFTSYSDDPHTVTEGAPSTWSDMAYKPAFDSSPAFGSDPSLLGVFFGPGGFLLPGESFAHTYNQTGDFAYRCKVHAGMEGWVHVVNDTQPLLPGGPGPTAASGSPSTVYVHAGDGAGQVSVDRFGPRDITVRVGTQVVWTNPHDTEVHTVTSNSSAERFDSSPNIPDFVNGPLPANMQAAFAGPGGTMQEFANRQFNWTFSAPGVWQYHCKLHTDMVGAVIVLPQEQAMAGNGTGSMEGGNASGGMPGSAATTKDTGSRVPGFEAPLLVAGMVAVALALRRR
jgi:plastocyanin